MPDVNDLAGRIWARRPGGRAYVVGLTGGVACGKSTLTLALAQALRALPGSPCVETVNTDGFLRPNAVLQAEGLINRKGFPETYDRALMNAALRGVRCGPTPFPGYSHRTYDVDPGLTRILAPPDVLVVEGLGLDRASAVDLLIYLDADEAEQEAWFVDRFMGFWRAGLSDDASFYARFRHLDAEGAAKLAAMVWTSINRVNLRDHIVPVRDTADILVRKGRDHGLVAILEPCGRPVE